MQPIEQGAKVIMLGLCRTSMSLQHSSKKDAKTPDGIVSIARSFARCSFHGEASR
jgi:hypothetical protein